MFGATSDKKPHLFFLVSLAHHDSANLENIYTVVTYIFTFSKVDSTAVLLVFIILLAISVS